MDKETDAYLSGTRGEAYFGGTVSEQLAHERGLTNRSGGGGGVPIILLPVVGVLMACLWPLVGAGTILAAGIGLQLLGWAYPRHDGMADLMVMLVAGGAGLYYTLKVERILQRSSLYRVVRHGVRLILFAALLVYVALNLGHGVLNPLYVPDEITLRWIDSQLSAEKYVAIFVLLLLVHVVSKRLDLKVEVWTRARQILGVSPTAKDASVAEVASELAYGKKEGARARWARRRKWGAIFGGVGAIFLAVIGEPAGSIVFGFIVFGLIGALLSRFLARKRPRAPSPT